MAETTGLSRLWIGAVGFLILIAFTLVAYAYFREEGDKHASVAEMSNARADGNYLEIDASIVSVDLQKDTIDMRLDFTPNGTLAKNDGTPSRAITVETTGINGNALEFAAGERILAHDVTFDLHNGEVSEYPFDKHDSTIEFSAVEKASESKHIPVETVLYAFHHGLDLSLKPYVNSETGYVGDEVTIRRSRLVIGVAVFCMVVMWGLAFSSVLVLWSALSHSRELDTGALALLSGLILAIYFFRAGLPDTPTTIGTLSDFLAFFWAEAIVSVVTIIYTWTWFQRGKDEPSKPAPVE